MRESQRVEDLFWLTDSGNTVCCGEKNISALHCVGSQKQTVIPGMLARLGPFSFGLASLPMGLCYPYAGEPPPVCQGSGKAFTGIPSSSTAG